MSAMRRIDLKHILQHHVSTLYGDLVTRPTGQKVRNGVERELAALDGEQVVVMDFSTVRCLDISCADEIVGKLLLLHGGARRIVLHGVTPSHCEAIEQVLERHGLAVVARDRDGSVRVLGPLADEARRAFELLATRGPARLEALARDLALAPEAAALALARLRDLRLVLEHSDGSLAAAPA